MESHAPSAPVISEIKRAARLRPATSLYTSFVAVAACILLFASLAAERSSVAESGPRWDAIGFFAIAVILANLCPLHLTHQTKVYVDTAVYTAMAILLGVPEAILIAAAAVVICQALRRDPAAQIGFNAAQTGLYVGLGCLTFHILARNTEAGLIPSIVATALVMHTVNTLLVSTVGALEAEADPVPVWRADLSLDLPEHLALVILGVLIAIVAEDHFWALPVFAAPIAVIYLSLRRTHAAQVGAQSAVEELAATVDRRTEWTTGHSERVAHLVERMAEQLGMPAHETARIAIAARVHDIGKISFEPPPVDPQTSDAFGNQDELRHHPSRGAELISTIPGYASCIPMIRHHHERWDGTGYPDRLAHESIPIGARLIAIASAYDHLISSPAYRSGKSTAAIAEIRRGAGTRFDPTIVDALASAVAGERREDGVDTVGGSGWSAPPALRPANGRQSSNA